MSFKFHQNKVDGSASPDASREREKPAGRDELPGLLGGRVLAACAAPMIIFESHANGCIVRYANPAFVSRTGYSETEITRVGWDGFDMEGGRERCMASLCAAIRERQELEIPLRIRGKGGKTSTATLHVSPVDNSDLGRTSYAVGVLRERTADAEYVTRLERDAHYDPLTGLPNRRLLIERARRAIAQALHADRLLAVALIDLDDFKLINDTLGHASGDEVLSAVGARLARDLRAGDFVARVGGDEFVLLLQDENAYTSLALAIERVKNHVEQPIHLHGEPVTVACSIGVAVCPGHGETLEALLERADRAMYSQKARHRSGHAATRFTAQYHFASA